jgi:anti-sigma B factor antagonist
LLASPAPNLSIDCRDDGRRIILAVRGEIDLATTPDLRTALEAAVDGGGRELWLDLCATTFMDSTGLHALFDADALAQKSGGRLEIVCPPGPVRRLFEIVGYDGRLSLHDELAR